MVLELSFTTYNVMLDFFLTSSDQQNHFILLFVCENPAAIIYVNYGVVHLLFMPAMNGLTPKHGSRPDLNIYLGLTVSWSYIFGSPGLPRLGPKVV